MVAKNKTEVSPSLKGGVVGGIVGGIVLAVILEIGAAALGLSGWAMLKGAAAPFIGERAMQPGFDAGAVLAGVICHFLVSIVWGVIFGFLAYGLSKSATIAAGMFYGLVVWIGMYYVVLPAVGLAQMTESSPVGRAILYHVIFGLAVALGFLPYQSKFPHRQRAFTPPVERHV